ncbi:hypothetical protein PR048_002453 [Dryococelus australis]|uniref:Uncharacterized protein n=1 Tax=Dryococelus australis TaxID=614101 RepID=A0ABQ9IK96_9NEOP|nr:hypothetical protein PR048_002453 [Dryococelus australis]
MKYNMDFFTTSKDKCLICKRYQEVKGEEKDNSDLQKVLQIPLSDVRPVYYSRKLCMYNLTV